MTDYESNYITKDEVSEKQLNVKKIKNQALVCYCAVTVLTTLSQIKQ